MSVNRFEAGRRISFLCWRDSGHPDGGGSEKFVERVAEHLARNGWEATICCAAYPGAPRDETRNGVHLRRRGGRLTVYLRGLLYLLSPAGRRADVVVDIQNGLPFFSTLVRRRGVVLLVHHVHREQWHIIYPGLLGHIGWWIESRLSPRLYRRQPYLTVSDATRHDLIELGVSAEQIEVVFNGIDVPHPHHLAPRAETPTICVLGRLVPHKQVEHALEIAARLRRTLPNLRVDVVGDGWWHERLTAHAVDLGVDDITTFHGWVDDATRDALLDRAWVLLVPSIKEGWGIAIMEAAARRVPAIAYASAGGVCESIIDAKTGWLVDSPTDMGMRTEELLSDRVLRDRMGAGARERARDFAWERTGERVELLLQRVLSSGAITEGAADVARPTAVPVAADASAGLRTARSGY